jgi:chromosome segregation ATPase
MNTEPTLALTTLALTQWLRDNSSGVYRPAAEAADVIEQLKRERDALRDIFPKILIALQSGNCAADCSVDFLQEIPKEVRLVRQRLERERDEAREQGNDMREKWLAKGQCCEYLGAELHEAINQRDEARETLASVTAQRDRLAKACDQYSEDEILCKLQEVTAQRDSYKERYTKLAGKYAVEIHELTEQRDRLAVALEQIIEEDGVPMSMRASSSKSLAKQALQSLTPNAEP